MTPDTIYTGDNVATLKTFPDTCIDLVVTSPPYDNLKRAEVSQQDLFSTATEDAV